MFLFFFFFLANDSLAGSEGRARAQNTWGHLRCTCSCTLAAPSSGRCGCASPAAAGGCSGPRWGGAAGSGPWTSGRSSRRRPAEREREVSLKAKLMMWILVMFSFILQSLLRGEVNQTGFNLQRMRGIKGSSILQLTCWPASRTSGDYSLFPSSFNCKRREGGALTSLLI